MKCLLILKNNNNKLKKIKTKKPTQFFPLKYKIEKQSIYIFFLIKIKNKTPHPVPPFKV